MTKSIEDYLKAIFFLVNNEEKITNKRLSEILLVSPPSVTEMLNKMRELDFLVKDKKIILTEKGHDLALKMMRKHRVWEEFLITKFNYTKEEVHDEAEKLEHATSDKLLEKLEEYLNYNYKVEDKDYR